jgi:hypothetical protein
METFLFFDGEWGDWRLAVGCNGLYNRQDVLVLTQSSWNFSWTNMPALIRCGQSIAALF